MKLAVLTLVFFSTSLSPFAVSAQTLTVLHAFSSPVNATNQDGANPIAGLTLSSNVLCGTTGSAGKFGAGTEFYLNADGSGFNVIRPFTNSPDGANPQGDLTVSTNRFYGGTFVGGANGTGALFSGASNGSSTLITSFAKVNADTATNVAGSSPCGSVILVSNRLYGAASVGGFFANGAIFSIATNGGTSTVLHTFTVIDSNTGTNVDGATPCGGLTSSGDTLFGTTSAGGAGGNGTIFSVGTNGSNFTTLYNFTAVDPVTSTNTDGAIPLGGLVLSNATLYGTTSAGGFGDSGVIFSIGTNGTGFTVLHQFTSLDALTGINADGAKPGAALVLSSNNVLYGTTPAGGAGANGTVFSVNPNGNNFTTLYSFSAFSSGTTNNADGANPVADLLVLGNSLYGTTFRGGPNSAGTIFSVSLPLPPATITDIVLNPDSSVTLSFAGSPNSSNIVQAAVSLTPPIDWQNVSTNMAGPDGSWQFTDTNSLSAKFYRSYSP